MISRFPYSSFKSINFDRRVPFVRMLSIVAVLGLIALDPPLAIWSMAVVYACRDPCSISVNRIRTASRAPRTMKKRTYIDRDIASSDITPEHVFLNRRALIKASAGTMAGALNAPSIAAAEASAQSTLSFSPDADRSLVDDQTPYDAVTTYNNFYEFGTDKSDPARHAHNMTTDPWTVKVGGLVNQPGSLHLEDVLPSLILRNGSIGFAASRHGRWWCPG